MFSGQYSGLSSGLACRGARARSRWTLASSHSKPKLRLAPRSLVAGYRPRSSSYRLQHLEWSGRCKFPSGELQHEPVDIDRLPALRSVWFTDSMNNRGCQETNLPFWLSPNAEHVLSVENYSDPPDPEEIKMASEIVSNDGKTRPPIDTTFFEQCDTFALFDGLKPKHLIARADDWGRFSFENYSTLNSPWPLVSLWIILQEAPNNTVKNDNIPSLYESLTSLGLYRCTRVGFPPGAPFKQLRHIQVFEYDACSMFTDIVLNCLENPNKLKVVKLHDWEHPDWFSPVCDLLQALQRCSSMEVLELKCNTLFSTTEQQPPLPKLLPSTLEHLRLRMLPSMASQMSAWMECAADLDWLPRLRKISLRFDADKHTNKGNGDEDNLPVPYVPMPEVESFLSALKSSRPTIEIDQSWSGVTPGSF